MRFYGVTSQGESVWKKAVTWRYFRLFHPVYIKKWMVYRRVLGTRRELAKINPNTAIERTMPSSLFLFLCSLQFYSPYSHATLFETDDRFRYFGFEILDLGCCKCISHPLWGPHTFVGTLFTDAPTSTPAIQSIMEL